MKMVDRPMCIHLTATSVLSTGVPGCTAFTPTGGWPCKNKKTWKDLQQQRKLLQVLTKQDIVGIYISADCMQLFCSVNFLKSLVAEKKLTCDWSSLAKDQDSSAKWTASCVCELTEKEFSMR